MKRRDRKILFKFLAWLLLFLLLAIFYLVWRSEPLLVKNIEVTTDYNVNPNSELVKILERSRNKNILSLNDKTLSDQIKATDLKIDQVVVRKKLPGRILLEIKSRQPIAVIPAADKFFLVDKDGLVFDEKKEMGSLPVLELGLQNIVLGSRIENKKSIFLILDTLKDEEEITRIWQTGEELQIRTKEGTLILFPLTGEIEEKLKALQTILKRLMISPGIPFSDRIEGKKPVKIDLRFEKPIIVF